MYKYTAVRIKVKTKYFPTCTPTRIH